MSLSILLSLALTAGVNPDTLHSVDLYGLRSVSEASVRAAVGLRAGDPVPASTDAIRYRVQALQGVAEVQISKICCSETGRMILYVGIRETGTPPLRYAASPSGGALLPAEIFQTEARYTSALQSAVKRGVAAEDGSQGYSLAQDSTVRAVQQEFIRIAARHTDTLISVLRTSANAEHRALAAQILAYGANRQTTARELLRAVRDPNDGVRNNATRALGVLAGWAIQNPAAGVRIPPDPFIDFLNSISWTDRNKGVFALAALTGSRDAAMLAELRRRALPALIEMARWKSAGHALLPFIVLARVAGLDDGAAFQAWQNGQVEAVIARAAK